MEKRDNMSTDTVDIRCKSIYGEGYYQVFANKDFFVKGYHITREGDYHEALDTFVRKYGIPDRMISLDSKNEYGN